MKFKFVLSVLFILLFICGCGNKEKIDLNLSDDDSVTIVDVYGNSVILSDNPRVVSAYGSFSECWLLAGGELVGVTDDAIFERNLNLPESTEIIGTVKDVNVEKIVSLNPDYVILSADIAAHVSIGESLETMNIPYGYFRVDSFDDYACMMRQFCNFTGREDLYIKNVLDVKTEIDSVIMSTDNLDKKSYLLMRAYSTGIKVKNDNIADTILKELGGVSITDSIPSLLKDLSVEEVIKANPDHIFILTMGDEQAGEKYFRINIISNPAWNGLAAIKNGNYHILPKQLFHYKPNNRWGESYAYIAKILYPEYFNNYEKK